MSWTMSNRDAALFSSYQRKKSALSVRCIKNVKPTNTSTATFNDNNISEGKFAIADGGKIKFASEKEILFNYSIQCRTIEVSEEHIYALQNRRIVKYDKQGNKLQEITIDNDAKYYIDFVLLPDENFALLDNKNNKVYFIDNNGVVNKTVVMLNSDKSHLQNVKGIVVDKNLIISENGHKQLLKINIATYEQTIFKDFSKLRVNGLGAIAYNKETYYVSVGGRNVYSFSENDTEPNLITKLQKGNITGITVIGNYTYVIINFTGEFIKINNSTGKYEVLFRGLSYPKGLKIF